MTMDERIEAAARALYAAYGDIFEETWDGASPGVRASFANDARSAFAAAFPDLTGDKPTHWIAPMEATEAMNDAVDDARDRYDHEFITSARAFEVARDAYLGKGDISNVQD